MDIRSPYPLRIFTGNQSSDYTSRGLLNNLQWISALFADLNSSLQPKNPLDYLLYSGAYTCCLLKSFWKTRATYCSPTSPALPFFTSPLTNGVKRSLLLVEFLFTTLLVVTYFEASALPTLYTHAIIFYLLWARKLYSHFLYDSPSISKSQTLLGHSSLLFCLCFWVFNTFFFSQGQCFTQFYPTDEQFSILFWLQFPLHNCKFLNIKINK